MSATAQRLATPVPKSMRTLERDARGYPIPWIVLRDKTGAPQFTINESRLVSDCLTKRLCAICGKRISGGFWFVGGSRAFLHERGAFLDPPTHMECAEYALRVCPFLAARRYDGRIDDHKLKPGGLPNGMTLVRDEHMMPRLPERFGFGVARTFEIGGDQIHIRLVVHRWDYVEWWRAGERIDAPQSGAAPP